jgi:hypothetical protein
LTSPNHVAELVSSRDTKADEIKSLDSAIDRLDRVSKSTSGAVTELASLHADHQARVEAWSLAGATDAIPAIDRKHLARLEQERDNHEDTKASAAAGLKTLVDKRANLQVEHRGLERAVTVAALLVIISEDLPRIADECKRARQAVVDRTAEYEGIRGSLLAQGTALSAPEIAHAVERLNISFEQPVANGDISAINNKLDGLMLKGAA